MKKQLLSLATGLVLAIGISAGCGGPKENKITWLESTGTITKSAQVSDNNYNWTMEFATDKGTTTVIIPGPGPGEIGKKAKLKYNQADPNSYQLLEELIKGI
jgi:hypothetical protein